MRYVTVWKAIVHCGDGNNPPLELRMVSAEMPTFEQIEEVWRSGFGGMAKLHRRRADGYYHLGHVGHYLLPVIGELS